MSVTLADLVPGQTVTMINDAHYSCPFGSTGQVVRVDSHDVLVSFGDESNWYYPSDLATDMGSITDLDLYKRLAARKMYEAKMANGWCSTAEYLARLLGMAEYLPIINTVAITHQVQVPAWPGDSEATVEREALRLLRQRAKDGNIDNLYRSGTEIVDRGEDSGEGADDAQVVEGETVPEFQVRLAATAIKGMRDHGVNGVPEFLRSVGIDPSTIRTKQTVNLYVQVEVEVGADEDVHDAAIAYVRENAPNTITVSD